MDSAHKVVIGITDLRLDRATLQVVEDGHGPTHGNTHAEESRVPGGTCSRGVPIPFDGFGIEAQDLGHGAVFVVAKVGSIGIYITRDAQASSCAVVRVGKNRLRAIPLTVANREMPPVKTVLRRG